MESRVQMAIGAEPAGVARVLAAFGEFAAVHGVPIHVRRGLQVVLDELLANVVTHGLAGRADGEALVDFALVDGAVALSIADNGPPFDPFGRDTPDTTLAVDDRPIGGLGIHLVRTMVDEFSYERRGDRNISRLLKRLA